MYQESFIENTTKIPLPLLAGSHKRFTHAILNPPYRKIGSQSSERKSLSKIGIETVNLYSAFVWLAMLLLEENGELTAITPRSFCNGAYFRPFRKAFLQDMALDNIHIFKSRSAAFSEYAVSQENIIFHAVKSKNKSELVTVTSNIGDRLEEVSEVRTTPYIEIVSPNDSEMFIRIITNYLDDYFKKQIEALPSTLEELGLEVSTGPVVDFRLKSALRNCINAQNVPLIYPESIKAGKVLFPPITPRKPIAIERNVETTKWLNQPGWYVLIRRFSAKEEKRRIVAAACVPFIINIPNGG